MSKTSLLEGEAVDRIKTYKYLDFFERKVSWKENINSVMKKVNSRMYSDSNPL